MQFQKIRLIYLQLLSLLHTLIQTTANDYLEKRRKMWCVQEQQWVGGKGKTIPVSPSAHTQAFTYTHINHSKETEIWSVSSPNSWNKPKEQERKRGEREGVTKIEWHGWRSENKKRCYHYQLLLSVSLVQTQWNVLFIFRQWTMQQQSLKKNDMWHQGVQGVKFLCLLSSD